MSKYISTWHCVKCDKDFPAGPMDEAPYAFEVIKDPKTGLRKRGGSICRACYFSKETQQ